jgi:hypothetical protein
VLRSRKAKNQEQQQKAQTEKWAKKLNGHFSKKR